MAFTPKDWKDDPDTTTPISAAALEDLETRVTTYSDGRIAGLRSTLVRSIFAMPTVAAGAVTQNRVYLVRCVIPAAGVLAGVSVWVQTSSGNIDVGVYDTGDTTAGSRTLLSSSGSTACPAANAWREVYTPSLSVTAGQHVDLALQADNGVAIFGRIQMTNQPGGPVLPAGYADAPGGALTKLLAYNTAGGFGLPAAITEANISDIGGAVIPYIIGRVTPS